MEKTRVVAFFCRTVSGQEKGKKNESLLNPCAYSHSESRAMFILKWVATWSLVSSADFAADYCMLTCTYWGQDSWAQEIPAWLGLLIYGVTTDTSDNSLLAFGVFQASKIGGTAWVLWVVVEAATVGLSGVQWERVTVSSRSSWLPPGRLWILKTYLQLVTPVLLCLRGII